MAYKIIQRAIAYYVENVPIESANIKKQSPFFKFYIPVHFNRYISVFEQGKNTKM